MENIFDQSLKSSLVMSLLSNLFQSDSMKNMAFGMVKKTMAEGNYKYFLIEIDQAGELELKTFTHEQQPVIMSQESISQLETVIAAMEVATDKLEKQMDRSLEENAKLVQMCGEQEARITELTEQRAQFMARFSQDEIDQICKTPTNGNDTEAAHVIS